MNGTEALRAVNVKPDIILLDINMPDISGLEVCKRIREYVSCPIIFLTARIEEADTIKGFQAGGDDYVVKPFKVNELGARVNTSSKSETNHYGMGLAICKILCGNHGGKISIENTCGLGAKVRISFMLEK